MHNAICDNCGQSCEVPFRPTGDKPVYCKNCFRKKDRGDAGAKKLFSAICDNCGKSCEVPFRPTGDKPVYCSDCFGGDHKIKSRPQTSDNSHLEKQLQLINEKLDQLLQATTKPKAVKKAKAIKVVKAKPKAKKTATKK